MSLNTLLDLDVVDLFDEETLHDFSDKFKETWADSPNELRVKIMEEASGEDCELLLTDYLLNFDDVDLTKDCSYDHDAYSSGVECSDEEGERSLASLKMSLKKTKNDSDGINKELPKSGKKKGSEKASSKEKKVSSDPPPYESVDQRELEKKEKDRLRSRNYRATKTQKLRQAEVECNELRENNQTLAKKNEELTEQITSLEEQVEYLKNIITNQSALSTILNTLTKHSGLEFQRNPLTCNSMKREREDNSMNEENCTKKQNLGSECVKKEKNGGICLHLAPGRMSLEFCKECHKSSSLLNE